ncbi:restriction endonuclease subunit S, partial [Candidatus Woesearchaeota archaeon]|nr:restriction endonuclease subunit S [Candidatus Woesearchaeota archaeon]
MNTYSSYKDSGVDWIGNIPSDWEVVRNKYLFDVTKNVVGEESDKYQLLSLTKRGVVLRDIESGKGKFPESFDTYQTVDKGDLIFCLYDIDETPRTIGISNYSGMITGSYKVVKCNTLTDPKFIYYNYLSIDDVKGLRPYYTGLRKVVRTETFLNLNVRVPSLQEQQQISDYLDYKTLKIDKLIEKTEQKIELLKEQRTSLINTTVTKGLDPNVEMKDSGVEWIG